MDSATTFEMQYYMRRGNRYYFRSIDRKRKISFDYFIANSFIFHTNYLMQWTATN